jgi:hypothetical protein
MVEAHVSAFSEPLAALAAARGLDLSLPVQVTAADGSEKGFPRAASCVYVFRGSFAPVATQSMGDMLPASARGGSDAHCAGRGRRPSSGPCWRPAIAPPPQDEAGALLRLRAAQQVGVLGLARCGLALIPSAMASLAPVVRVVDVSHNKVCARAAGLLHDCCMIVACARSIGASIQAAVGGGSRKGCSLFPKRGLGAGHQLRGAP